MAPESLVGLLAEPRRMRVFAAVVLGAEKPVDVAERTGLTLREVHEALRRLADGALVSPARRWSPSAGSSWSTCRVFPFA